MELKHIRNFSIIAHIDHGKSTLADRMLENTHTIEARKMRDQVLDSMELERERGITIKMQPVRMEYHPRGPSLTNTQNNAEINANVGKEGMEYHPRGQSLTDTQKNAESSLRSEFLYGDITYKIRGAIFEVRKRIGLGHKEIVYHKALEIEFTKRGLSFESEKIIEISYESQKIGTYIPDFIIEDKVLVELKALPSIGRPQEEQVWSYLKGCSYKLALLVNFGNTDVEIKRVVYDTARAFLPILRHSASIQRDSAGVSLVQDYILNLIDTPGHIDFSYEVSRALKAVEGSILLVDATQGVQAQTLTTLEMARESGLVIIPVLSKVDSSLARVYEVKMEVALLLDIDPDTVLEVSGKTGLGVENLLKEIVNKIPAPKQPEEKKENTQALVFDFKYDNHRGVIVYVRVFNGQIKKGDSLLFSVSKEKFICLEVGIFAPEEKPKNSIDVGEIGYIVTGIKKPGIASVGDTITLSKNPSVALPGYMNPRPVVWASVYPEDADDFPNLKLALGRLRLSDSAFSFEEESSGTLGKGFRCGFLGMLHLEIITERLKREFGLHLVVTMPSITYKVILKNGKEEMIYSPHFFPEDGQVVKIYEPWVKVKVIAPDFYASILMPFLFDHEAIVHTTENFGDNRSAISLEMPLRELMRNFFDDLKSITSGYGSISYEIGEYKEADVVRLDILVADEPMMAFCRVVARKRVEEEARSQVERLKNIIPRQQFAFKIQGKALGRIIASESVSAFRKDVLMHGSKVVGGGDVSRKKKLLEKQKKGKARMKENAKINITQDVFLKMMRSGDN